ncbi:MAG TPA: ABC transporter ATP-binding protein [Thermodesulfobacteriota bacterium]|nr:ABC transporter ATP-binding protein [Thermodesulfobacteriota bacterium]
MLQLVAIHTYYGDSYILQGLSLQVKKASVVAVLGRNGMGKTTTIRSIVGLNPPRQGKILFKGTDIAGIEPFRVARMGIAVVPQGRRIFPSLTVGKNLTIVPESNRTQVWNMDKVMTLFPRLKERLNTKARFLSGGELQMLAIARALVSNPELLLMDEPSEGLAPIVVKEVGQVIQQLKRESGLSILLVEQNIKLAIDVADAIYILSNGKVVYESTPQELDRNHQIKAQHLGV